MLAHRSEDQAGERAMCSSTQASISASRSSLLVLKVLPPDVRPGQRLLLLYVHWHQWHDE